MASSLSSPFFLLLLLFLLSSALLATASRSSPRAKAEKFESFENITMAETNNVPPVDLKMVETNNVVKRYGMGAPYLRSVKLDFHDPATIAIIVVLSVGVLFVILLFIWCSCRRNNN